MKKISTSFILFLLLFCSTLFVSSCKDDEEEEQDSELTLDENQANSFLSNYANIVYASYEDSYNTAKLLDDAIQAFAQNPSEATLEAAKTAWKAAREPYGQTESYRFYGGPIDGDEGVEGLINAWPLDESYIDYVTGNPTIGIINNPTDFPTIDKQVLMDANEQDGETNISTGYHAIEFLLWGQDVTLGAGGGDRAFTDYTTADNADRRTTYLLTASSLLLDHLQFVLNEWTPNTSGNYRDSFENSSNPKSRLLEVLVGVASLSKGELAGERIFVALDEPDRENEHSCFSDNTDRDVVTNALAIDNVYFGRYTRTDGTTVSGTSISDIFELADTEKTALLDAKMNETMVNVNAVQNPFETEIVEADGRARLQACVTSLTEQADMILEIASLYGINIELE
ncbi:putative iron-regulated protein [Bernardetia litoralis DSM 6794]|uniref:Putative iron-regulated protein n=1 Tax=Bernardetia litoralis (strain ATCC 23117 / DSM 6794 / NBRC 15988 / NCIMB 1366 / Fx l1 / Sio-4) TaxID=880071 RepID=I4ANL3_BERLS|nr:imelysin family protein [Bernardetia litoralis]AFM05548.1 putative iron-regulated protein [Bernardetia litoralis DSM 6794]